jgi:hypothetical protein
MSGDNNNIELILKHLMEQQDKHNSLISHRLDKMSVMLDDLRDHKGLVLQLDKRMDSAEINLSDIRDKVQKLIYDSNRREDVKKSITNPLIMRALWSIMGVAGCVICIVIGFSYKAIDEKSRVEMINLMKSQSH